MSLASNGIPTAKELKDLQKKKRLERKEKRENPQPKVKENVGWIQTRSGIKFYPFAPAIADINIEDIAWHLSHINRFLGAATSPWSVGQHSIFGAWLIFKLTEDKLLALRFLFHDSPEAYLGDLIRPFKLLPQFSFYKDAEYHLYSLILHKFQLINLNHTTDNLSFEPQIVKDMDRFMLYLEIEELRNPIHPDNAYKPGSTEHLELQAKLGWKEEYRKYFYELLEKNSKVINKIFLMNFVKYSKG